MLDISTANDYLDNKLSLGHDSASRLNDSELALLQEYKELRRKSSKNEILKGFWQTVAGFTGPQPSSCEGAKMIAVKDDLYVFGGFSREAYGEMRTCDLFENKWTVIETESIFDRPSARFGHSMDLYKDYLVVFGGSGAYNKTSKMRVCNSEIHVFDMNRQKWIIDYVRQSREQTIPRQRMYHASSVFGDSLLIHGGMNTDDKEIFSDFHLFNIEYRTWVELMGVKKVSQLIGARQMHTITTVLPPSLIENDFNNLWKSPPNATSEALKYQYWGMYLFGGYKKDEGQMNDIWLIRPQFKNKQDAGTMKRKRQMTANFGIEAVKLEPDGKPPVARSLHTTVFIKNRYLVIYGGKSKDIYSSTRTISLNDICIYDIQCNKWDAIVTYGFHPNSRWSHCMTVHDQDKIIVFGGANLNNYCNISLSVLTITNNVFRSKNELKDKNPKKKSKLLKEFIKNIERLYGDIKSHLK